MMKRRLYTGFSLFQFLLHIAMKLVLVFVIILSLSHYDENPVVISVVAGISLLLLLALGDDQLVVYDDRVVQTTNSFLSLLFSFGDITYFLSDIKKARLKPPPVRDIVEDIAAATLYLILPKPSSNRNKTEPIFFDLKSGKTVQFNTDLEDYKMRRIVDLVDSLLSERKS